MARKKTSTARIAWHPCPQGGLFGMVLKNGHYGSMVTVVAGKWHANRAAHQARHNPDAAHRTGHD